MVGLDFCSGPCSHLHSPSRDASRKPAWSPWSLRLAASLSRPSPWVCEFLGGSLESHLSMKMLSSHWSGLLTFPRPLHVQVTPRQATRPQNASHACPVRPFLITTTQALCTHPGQQHGLQTGLSASGFCFVLILVVCLIYYSSSRLI